MLTDKKITAYSKIVAGLPDVPSPAMSALQLKQHFDTAPEEMRVAFNALIDNLLSTATGDSGAESIGIEPIVGVSAANVQNALEQLKLLINDAVSGTIPNGTLGPEKLNFDVATQAELDTHVADTVTHVPYALATGAANTYAVTLTPAPTSYTRGMAVSVEINVLNTGASTININGLGAKSIKKSNGNDVLAGNLKVGIIYTLRYNGTNFILQGEGGEYGTATVGDVLAPLTIGTEGGVVPGTLTLTGNAADADVLAGKTYYNTNAKTKRTGTGVQGKLYASGSGVVSGSTNTNYMSDSGANQGVYSLTVNGLNFPNAFSAIVVKCGVDRTIYDVNGLGTTTGKIVLATNSTAIIFTTNPPVVIGTTSFTLPVNSASTAYSWEVWGN